MAEETENVKWMNYATKDEPAAGIPVGIRFQATVPDYSGFSHARNDLSTKKWLGEQTWSVQDQVNNSKRGAKTIIGAGYKPVTCLCQQQCSIKCVESQLTEERRKLKDDLKSAYQSWKFDQVGNVVSESWSQEDRNTFRKIVKEKAKDGFMKKALESLPLKTRSDIVGYYLNVYIPSRISKESRYAHKDIVTDESDGEKDGSGSSSKANKYLLGGGPSFNDES